MTPQPDLSLGVPAAALDELVAVYRELDADLAALGAGCRQCGRCCDFARNDYRLYASRLERALVAGRHGVARLTPSGRCAFLADGRCSIHPARPLGCRTFFCDRAHKAREQALHHRFQRRLRAIADRYAVAWGYEPFFEGTHPLSLPGRGRPPQAGG